ncbi:MAG: response regulator [Proteobacteria bacterium]|nr:response regulator [Pseudomonadota bacterium]MBU1716629.1 response regulator [Pseudomonadota bacterium]
MVDTVSGLRQHISLSPDQLLYEGEVIAIVDDDPAIREPLQIFLEEQGLNIVQAGTAQELLALLDNRKVALILLDIGLPDIDGRSLLPKIVDNHRDVAIVMLTGIADLKIALDCIREGADDYLSKPAQFNEILFVVKKTLEKRRLVFENRKYQEDLEKAHFRIHVLHQLSIKMNTAYLSTVEVDEILQAILVGITANEGLRFNRAFLAMFDQSGEFLEGRMAIGPSCRSDAAKIWTEIQKNEMNFLEIVHDLRSHCTDEDLEVNRIVKSLRIPSSDHQNILIQSSHEKRSIRVERENGSLPMPLDRRNRSEMIYGTGKSKMHIDRRSNNEEQKPLPVPQELINLLGEDSFIIVPLYSPSRSFGVIIADNFITRQRIMDSHVSALELFASQASLAIEHSHLYAEMQKKIGELQELNEELDKNKNLLVEAERYSALGQMSAQLVHAIRNPITSIGGVSRILSKKTKNEEWLKYLKVIIKETARLEATLEDLFDFVGQAELKIEPVQLYSMLRKTLMLVQPDMLKHNITWELEMADPELEINVDHKQMRQMFLHLVKNAIEAMPNGGKISLSVEIKDGWAHISVHDTGAGIPENYIEKATDPFFTTKTYGTGMGLTMVQRVTKSHGGNFSMNQHEGSGLEITINLPLQNSQT